MPLSDTEKMEIDKYLADNYVLINKKSFLAYLIVAIVAITGVNYQISATTASRVMAEEAVKRTRENILKIENDVSSAKQRIEAIANDMQTTIAEQIEEAKKKVADIEGDTKSLAKRLSTTPFDYISAKSIALIDKDGMNRMLLTSSENGSAALYLYDRQYKARMELYENNGSVGLNLLDRYGRGRMMLMMDSANGVPRLAVKNNEGKLLLELYENSSGTLSLQLKDRQSNNRVELTNGETKGSYQLIFTDGKMVQKFP